MISSNPTAHPKERRAHRLCMYVCARAVYRMPFQPFDFDLFPWLYLFQWNPQAKAPAPTHNLPLTHISEHSTLTPHHPSPPSPSPLPHDYQSHY